MRGGKRLNAGRPNGSKSRTTLEIRQILDKVVNFETMSKKFYQLALKGNIQAGKLLYEFRFSYPKEASELEERQYEFIIGGKKPAEQKIDKIEIVTVHRTLEEVQKARAEQEARKNEN